jgi:hypothetical protein
VTDDAKCKNCKGHSRDEPVRLLAYEGKTDAPLTACEVCDCMDRWPINQKG